MKVNKVVITKIIKELGIPANLKGYRYIICGVEMLADNIELIGSIMNVYKGIAEKFNITHSRVERAIRHAIEVGWVRANLDLVDNMFGYSVDSYKGKSTNSEFLATVADYILITQDHPTEKGGAE